MKVLWLCNVMLPQFAQSLGVSAPIGGGWLVGAAEALIEHSDTQLYICAAQNISGELLTKTLGGICFYGYPASKKGFHRYNPSTEKWFRKILDQVRPDLVHIWGTEYPHTLAMVRAYNCPEKTIISIQGLCKYYTCHYLAYLPGRIRCLHTFRDMVRRDSMIRQQKKFAERGRLEEQALASVGHVIGRTRWDRACTKQSTPQAQYYFCNEILRSSFYEHAGTWTPEGCERHSIFVSQSSYPIKGLHLALQAMPKILQQYPDTKLYTTGKSPFEQPTFTLSGYRKLLVKQIKALGLEDKVVFLGSLSEEKMCRQFLKSHVFVSASSIENSANSVGESMLLGVPSVASYVGGVMDLMKDGEEGFLYQSDAPYMLAEYVCKIFSDDELARSLGKNATAHAMVTHDRERNTQALLSIYHTVYNG